MGRRLLMTLSGVLFVVSIPVIALSHSYEALVLGRLLQGISAGLIGVVVPLYLAEVCRHRAVARAQDFPMVVDARNRNGCDCRHVLQHSRREVAKRRRCPTFGLQGHGLAQHLLVSLPPASCS